MKKPTTTWVAMAACSIFLGCVPAISNSYRATVLDDSGQKSVRQAIIKVAPDVKVRAYGECFPRSDRCRIGIWWHYPKSSDAAFAPGHLTARDVKDHGTICGLANVVSANMGGYGDKRDEVESMMVLGVDLYGDTSPRELELVMHPLKVEGVPHEIPVIRFRHSRGPSLVPIIYNY